VSLYSALTESNGGVLSIGELIRVGVTIALYKPCSHQLSN
jgi:hypothetical protein